MLDLPKGFVRHQESETNIKIDLRYFSKHNFVGSRIDGYYNNVLILTHQAYTQLLKIQKEFMGDGYTLVIYDAYRPQKSVEYFSKWGKDISDTKMKEIFYPHLDKKDIHSSGYLASSRSTHTRGSTVDLTLISLDKSLCSPMLQHRKLNNGKIIPFYNDNTVDMGSSFDLFDEVSWYTNKDISPSQYEMRMYLQQKMIKYGFEPYEKEWWHFTLKDELFPNTYFNFDIK
ncbi:MAG: M15 family metallopeptidase [Rickettsiales bacterium]|nr:M15 family metallopeptidase [Rickettsiales bacterium]